jgi:hypothetical protein
VAVVLNQIAIEEPKVAEIAFLARKIPRAARALEFSVGITYTEFSRKIKPEPGCLGLKPI